ncbi:MAG: transglycosylase SLT domain-containing protein [Bauldia sp.]|nr:transglycosylase SLT domain-containing protein [Bauldia sp.]
MKKTRLAFLLLAVAVTAAGCARAPHPTAAYSSGREVYEPLVRHYARANNVPVDLALAVIQNESSFNPAATGAVGEVGLMQLRLTTAQQMGYRGTVQQLYDPATNIAYGMAYLGAAYHAGGRTVCGTMMKYQGGLANNRETDSTRLACQRVTALMRAA